MNATSHSGRSNLTVASASWVIINSTSQDAENSTAVVVKTIDSIIRIWSLIIHLVYFAALLFSSYLKSNSMIYVTHVNAVSFMFCLIYMCYFSQEAPQFESQYVNVVLCSINEIAWAVLRYLRVYSLLLIAFHRYLAVFRVCLYKKMTASIWYLSLPILVVWFGSTLLVFVVKYATNTTSAPVYCAEGYSTDATNALAFFIIHTSLSTILPSIAIIVLYYLITKKLSLLSKKLKINSECLVNSIHSKESHHDHHDLATQSHHHEHHQDLRRVAQRKKKEKRFAYQFLAINLFDMVCSISSITMNACVSLSLEITYMRSIDRVILIFFQSMTPVVTLYFHPNKAQLLKSCFQGQKSKFNIPLHDFSIRNNINNK